MRWPGIVWSTCVYVYIYISFKYFVLLYTYDLHKLYIYRKVYIYTMFVCVPLGMWDSFGYTYVHMWQTSRMYTPFYKQAGVLWVNLLCCSCCLLASAKEIIAHSSVMFLSEAWLKHRTCLEMSRDVQGSSHIRAKLLYLGGKQIQEGKILKWFWIEWDMGESKQDGRGNSIRKWRNIRQRNSYPGANRLRGGTVLHYQDRCPNLGIRNWWWIIIDELAERHYWKIPRYDEVDRMRSVGLLF